ncbi:MAG TPA: hypothetical protein VHO25_02665 [Polyangiaceae bacterium]|nr:hypothetical protein [Polyangiaceae bacterium]
MNRRLYCGVRASLALSVFLSLPPAWGATVLDDANAELSRLVRDVQLPPAVPKSELPATAAQRLAAAELMMRTADHPRAIDELTLIQQLHRQGAADLNLLVDATFLLGEAYFADQQLLAARRQLTTILEGAPTPPFMAYAGRAVARLGDIAVALQDEAALQWAMDRALQLPVDASGSVEYARSKLYLARGDQMQARVAASHVGPRSKYYPQVQYLLGVIELAAAAAEPAADKAQPSGTLPDRYIKAVTQFQRVTQLKVETKEHRQVVNTAWLALGRIFYETANYLDASHAYNHIRKGSSVYATMLNELSWTYVRLGDYENALPLLETLSLTEADTLRRVDGALLRGDVLLRSEKDAEALQTYQEVRGRYEPLRAELADYLGRHADGASYYDLLLADPSVQASAGELSPPLLGWISEAAREQTTLVVARDDADCRTLLDRSNELSRKLSAALSSTSRVRLFPTQRAEYEHWESLQNRVAWVRWSIAEQLDRVWAATAQSGVTQERRQLMVTMAKLPRSKQDFARRERDGQWQWASASWELQRATLDANRLQALVNGLRRLLDTQVSLGRGSERGVIQLQGEIVEQQRAIAGYQQRIEEYQSAIELGRVQIGLGDQRFINDRVSRTRFAELLAAELQAIDQQASNEALREVAAQARPLLEQAAVIEQQASMGRSRLDGEIRRQAARLSREVAEEARKLQAQQQALRDLESEARSLLGTTAKGVLVAVEERLTDLVRRSDGAVAAQAWEARERSQRRVIELQHRRAVEEAQIKQDLAEILGDGKADP